MKKIFNLLFAWMGILLFGACTSMDHHYVKYIEEADRIYPGKADSVIVHPGYYRTVISCLLSADPKVTDMRIYWQNRLDSVVVPINATDIGKRKNVAIDPLTEGTYSFEIITFDVYGNRSVSSESFGRVYGEKYVAGLNNRVVEASGKNTDNIAFIRWIPITSEMLIGTKVVFPDQQGNLTELVADAAETTTLLPDYKFGELIEYRAMFLPDTLAIDTLYSIGKTISIE